MKSELGSWQEKVLVAQKKSKTNNCFKIFILFRSRTQQNHTRRSLTGHSIRKTFPSKRPFKEKNYSMKSKEIFIASLLKHHNFDAHGLKIQGTTFLRVFQNSFSENENVRKGSNEGCPLFLGSIKFQSQVFLPEGVTFQAPSLVLTFSFHISSVRRKCVSNALPKIDICPKQQAGLFCRKAIGRKKCRMTFLTICLII